MTATLRPESVWRGRVTSTWTRSGLPSWSLSKPVSTQRSWRIHVVESAKAGTTCAMPLTNVGRAGAESCAVRRGAARSTRAPTAAARRERARDLVTAVRDRDATHAPFPHANDVRSDESSSRRAVERHDALDGLELILLRRAGDRGDGRAHREELDGVRAPTQLDSSTRAPTTPTPPRWAASACIRSSASSRAAYVASV